MLRSSVRRLLSAAIVTACLLPVVGRSATIEPIKNAEGRVTIRISGELVRGDDERFATVAGGVSDDALVILNSPGGNLVSGLSIGSAIRMRGWDTAVVDDTTCASACGLAWLGGAKRMVGQRARLGFHAAYIEGADGVKREVGSGNALVGSYLARLGLRDAAVIYLTSASPSEAAWLDENTAKSVGIRAVFGSVTMPESFMPAPVIGQKPPSTVARTAFDSAAMLRQLYAGFPGSVRTKDGESCVGRACKVRVLGTNAWTDKDGVERSTIAAVMEVKDDCHACSAILGLGQFKRTGETEPWRSEILMPAAARLGGYGLFGGKLTFGDGGALGRVISIEDAGGGMGVFSSSASFWVISGNVFKEALTVPLSLSMNGACEETEAACKKRISEENYDSSLKVGPADDGSFRVDQTFTAAISIPPASWVIDAAGRSRQTAGGKATMEATARDRATLEGEAFTQGRADRVAMEAWFTGMQADFKAGADSWASRRNLKVPGSCDPPAGKGADWTAGCSTAKQKFMVIDGRRKAEPDYRRGWNSL